MSKIWSTQLNKLVGDKNSRHWTKTINFKPRFDISFSQIFSGHSHQEKYKTKTKDRKSDSFIVYTGEKMRWQNHTDRSPHGAETVSGLPSPPLERTLVFSNRPNNRPNCTSCVQRRERKLRLYDVTCLQLEEGCSTVPQPKQPDLSVWVPALCQPVRR